MLETRFLYQMMQASILIIFCGMEFSCKPNSVIRKRDKLLDEYHNAIN